MIHVNEIQFPEDSIPGACDEMLRWFKKACARFVYRFRTEEENLDV